MESALNTLTASRLMQPPPSAAAAEATLRTTPVDPPRDWWDCPRTGLRVPKTLAANLKWRNQLRMLALNDAYTRDSLSQACEASFLFWCNAFVWTYRQKRANPDGVEVAVSGKLSNVPFITWAIQDEAVEEIQLCIEHGEDINLEKSRDMGATWLVLALSDWYLLWHENVNIGVVSRKEQLVDRKGDMDSLFEKLKYIHSMLPSWQLPQVKERFMVLHNVDLNSSITGESTNADVGRGGRKIFYFVDEAAAITNGTDIEHSLSQNCVSQLWVSTPRGPNTAFHERIIAGRGKRIQLPWWRHPEKAVGAHQVRDRTGAVKWTSKWYERQCAKHSRKTVAQEIDMDHGQAGEMFFDFAEIQRHRTDHECEPLFVGDLIQSSALSEMQVIESVMQMDPSNLIFIRNHGRRPWHFWCDFENGRPPQYWSYVFGIDVSNGSGNSNSVISVLAADTGKIVAKWWDAYVSPEQLAVHAALAGIWFGGARPPALVVWENNGPGGIFGRKLVSLQYPLYYRQRAEGTTRKTQSMRWGWNSNHQKKEVLLGLYRDALARDSVVNPCKESLDEAGDYIYSDTAQLIPSRLREESSGGRALHGDHVVADALTVLGRDEMPRHREMPQRAPQGTFAWRKKHANAAGPDPWRGGR